MLLEIEVTVPVSRLSLHSCHAGQTGSRQRPGGMCHCRAQCHNSTAQTPFPATLDDLSVSHLIGRIRAV